jgi:hypothetical protein
VPSDAHFGEEAFPAHRIGRQRTREEFQCDRLAQLQIICAIDLAHSAAAEQPDDAVAVHENRAGCESSHRY